MRAPQPTFSLSAPRGDRSSPAPRNRGRDNVVPPLPGRPPPIGHTQAAHTPTAPTPEREHASKQAGAKGRRDHTVPPPPSERTQASTQTPQANTGSSANTQPQPPASKHAHSKPQQVRPQANTRNVPTPTRVGTPSVSAGTRVLAEATGTNEAQTTNAGTQDNAHNKRANNQVCVRCAPAPAREDSAREGRSQ